MTLEELIAATPDDFKPIVQTYAPLLLEWTQQEVWSWINDLANHRTDEAWAKIMGDMPSGALLEEGENIVDTWDALNKANSDRMKTQRAAAMAIMQVLLGAALALVGL